MRRFARQLLAHRSTLAVLALLLAFGPFLHGHFGRAHATGFHLDGLDVLEHHHGSGPTDEFTPSDLESPAEGVAVVASRSAGSAESSVRSPASPLHAWPPAVSTFWALLILSALQSAERLWRRASFSRQLPPRPAQAGLPPPTLAPPLQH